MLQILIHLATGIDFSGSAFSLHHEFQLAVGMMSMSMSVYFLFFLFSFFSVSLSQSNATVKCPLDFSIQNRLAEASRHSNDANMQCRLIRQGIGFVQSDYLRRTNSFIISAAFNELCWKSLQSLFDKYPNHFDIRTVCGITDILTQDCHNITTRSQYEAKNSDSTLNSVIEACNQSLKNGVACATCTTSITSLEPSYAYDSDCVNYKWIYAAAFANSYGPADRHTVECLFALTFDRSKSDKKHGKTLIIVFSVSGFLILVMSFVGFWWLWRYKLKMNRNKKEALDSTPDDLDLICGDTTLIKFSFSEIEKATKNFSRLNIIGSGGFGNVYKGVLLDGTEVALKRFKNCSSAGDASFSHEVEVIASVRHVNLVALRGYCIAMTKPEGHQRIIVCDMMKNGSLHDHLFGSAQKKLSWPIRQKIALGTARGLAYLHYGAQPAIIHRDIKASNILLDDDFEPKVADFGLAKFAPEGVSHVSTRVAGTMGYVAPEYALYGQLTERSDVYSFGIVLLELLSGKKALIQGGDDPPTLIADWAWSLVKIGRPLDVVEEGTLELGPPEIMEKYIMLAVLCSHPQLYARPTMDQVVKILDSDLPVPVIPVRPTPITADVDGTEKSFSSMGSSSMSSYSTY